MRSFSRRFAATVFAATAIACVTMALTSCASSAAKPATSSSASSDSGASAGFGDPVKSTAKTLEDDPIINNLTVDPNGGDPAGGLAANFADDKAHPAPIAKNGNVYLSLQVVGNEVPRQIVRGFIARSSDASSGRALECGNGIIGPGIICTAEFNDKSYSSGVYFAIIHTEPLSGYEQYGPKTLRTTFYTMKHAQ